MRLNQHRAPHWVANLVLCLFGSLAATVGLAQAPIIQPGKPGEPSQVISAEEAVELAGLRYSAADVKFLRDMIPHHQQALDMAALVAERTSRNEMIELAGRIEASQNDEIAFMQGWLAERGEDPADVDWHHHADGDHAMEGMATMEQMTELEASSGPDFDALFLKLMIDHHEGALTMVQELLAQGGSAQDPVLFEFTSDIENDQEAEIERMSAMLLSYSPDPRVGLAPGFRDAGEALWNMTLVASLPKPDGFFDPENPGGRTSDLGLSESSEDDEESTPVETDDEADQESDKDSDRESDEEPRPTLLDFANTDMTFFDDVLVVGNYHGFQIYRLAADGLPELLSAVVCPGGQGDVSVVDDLLIMSVEQNRGRLDCGLMGIAEEVSEERFRGLRIFDISDLTMPKQVGAVQTCRGSHTHSVVSGPGEDGRIIVYNSGTAPVREEDELEGCLDEDPYRDERTALFRIDVVEIPVDRPQDAHIIHSPAVFADPESGNLAGLWESGDHGPRTQTTSETNHCHDITAFPELGIAAGACSGNGILFDISDPINPTRIDEVIDTGFAYWHSATFNNDGTKVIFTDEWGGGSRPRCRPSDPLNWGANAIYDIVDGQLEFASYFKMPAPQTEFENCVAHNGSLVPVPGRDIMVQAWYQGGISVFDFTDSNRPVEIAYFDRGPIHADELVTGGFWSTYWYRGHVYGTEIIRGLDVLALAASDYLSESELAAAALADVGGAFNPQQQLSVSWPADPDVARAWRDQLLRGGHLNSDLEQTLNQALERSESALANSTSDPSLAGELDQLSETLAENAAARSGLIRKRLLGLHDSLTALAERLR